MSTLLFARNFQEDRTPLNTDPKDMSSPLLAMQGKELSRDNYEFVKTGIRMWCRGGLGAAFMIRLPRAEGRWEVESRIHQSEYVDGSGPVPLDVPSSKVCELIWPTDGWPPEIDFNESALRTRSNQTIHYGKVDPVTQTHPMRHTTYEVDQTVYHEYAVEVRNGRVSYFCDDVEKPAPTNPYELDPLQQWQMHVRTTPNEHDDISKMDVRSVRIYS